jgi:hypothetical protein
MLLLLFAFYDQIWPGPKRLHKAIDECTEKKNIPLNVVSLVNQKAIKLQ